MTKLKPLSGKSDFRLDFSLILRYSVAPLRCDVNSERFPLWSDGSPQKEQEIYTQPQTYP